METLIRKSLSKKDGRFKVRGESMYPLLKSGSQVILTKSKNIDIGDIVLFHDKGLVLHRVVNIYGDRIITKGDNNFHLDTPICSKSIIGKVKFDKSHVKHLLRSIIGRVSFFLGKIYGSIIRFKAH